MTGVSVTMGRAPIPSFGALPHYGLPHYGASECACADMRARALQASDEFDALMAQYPSDGDSAADLIRERVLDPFATNAELAQIVDQISVHTAPQAIEQIRIGRRRPSDGTVLGLLAIAGGLALIAVLTGR